MSFLHNFIRVCLFTTRVVLLHNMLLYNFCRLKVGKKLRKEDDIKVFKTQIHLIQSPAGKCIYISFVQSPASICHLRLVLSLASKCHLHLMQSPAGKCHLIQSPAGKCHLHLLLSPASKCYLHFIQSVTHC